jgi:hypothetical protein
MEKLIYILPLFFTLNCLGQITDSTEIWAPYIVTGEECEEATNYSQPSDSVDYSIIEKPELLATKEEE